MAVKTFTTGEVLTASDTNTYLANAGLVYITGGIASGATTLNVDNCFTTTYDNYRLVITRMQVNTTGRAFRLNYRASGSTNTDANYRYAYRGLKVDGVGNDTNNASTTFAEIGVYLDSFADTDFGSSAIDIYSPKLSARTHALVAAQGYEGNYAYRNGGFVFGATNAFDGFAISLSSTGTFTLYWRIYGYRQS